VTSCALQIKTRLQTQNVHAVDRCRGVWDCGLQLYRTRGAAALWRGFGPCMARSVPANAVAFLAFEKARATLQ
jgi:solute carrier family 25 carnitine/acylcarnitine transporter 20/29